ncbi:Ig-like domain-containing protein [Geobacter sp.]|uniref:Ig-like domain-containing protein n=1 Tax=Geobacter sp. TaxID=46610 RepID=UPI001AC232E5|nr:Ig-like domain-containing protein [Geobacter sp.]CAG0941954.1 hypothetical protein ANRL1_00758 [Anaerolineae bacterium]
MNGLLKVFSAAMVLGALVAGCGGGGGGGGSSSGVIVDTIPPSVVYTTPVNNETNVGTNTKITVTFSEAVEPATVTKDTFELARAGTTADINTVTYDETNKIATITPSPLLGNQTYTVTVKRRVTDTADNVMTADYTWKFETGAGADIIPPVLNSKAPADNATGVGTNTSIAMSFSEPMDISTFSSAFSLAQVIQLVPAVTVGIPVPGTFSLIGQVVVFTPDTPLIPGDYIVTLTTDAKDLADNGLAAPVSWSFTTGAGVDGTAPRVLGVSPAAGAPNVPTSGTSISVTFDEAIYPDILGSINGIATKIVVDYATNMITMTPTTPLTANKDYTFRIRVRDLSGNQMPNIYEWTFTTGN